MTNNTFRFYYSFEISNSPKAKHGLPFSGEIIAETPMQAHENVMRIAKEIADNLFTHQENFHFVDWELMENKPNMTLHVSHTLSISDVQIKFATLVSDWGDCHDKALRDMINSMWANTTYYEKMKTIVGAYWERDKEELANFFDEDCVWWHVDHLSFEGVCNAVGYDNVADELFNHIFDDADYQAIINYVRPKGWEELV